MHVFIMRKKSQQIKYFKKLTKKMIYTTIKEPMQASTVLSKLLLIPNDFPRSF